MHKQIFGSFSKDHNNPLSRISQANSCISLDPFVGCSLGCAYCYRHNSKRDSDSSKPRRIFKDEDIVNSLVNNIYFIPNKTIIGLGVASTDSFLPGVRESSFNIMNILSKMGYKNPFWFVIKSGVPKNSFKKFQKIVKNGNKIVISISYSGMPKNVEPFSGNRFANIKEVIRAGVDISLHLRPIVPGWNDTYSNLERIVKSGVENGCTSVCVGGLRYLDGVENAIVEKYGISFPGIKKSDLVKTLPRLSEKNIKEIFINNKITIPLFKHSSEMISYYLGIKDYNMYFYRKEGCFLQIPEKGIVMIERNSNKSIIKLIEEALGELKLKSRVIKQKNRYFLSKKLNYIEERGLLHRLSLSKFC